MKLKLLVITCALVLFACDKKQDKITASPSTDAQRSRANVDKVAAACNTDLGILVVNTAKYALLGLGDYESDYECILDIGTRTHTHDYKVITLANFSDEEDQFKWLQDNSHFICLEESYKYITPSHEIASTQTAMLQAIQNPIADDAISLAELKKIGIDFSAGYEHFMIVTFDSSHKVQIKLTPDYVATSTLYSIPFLNSILLQYDAAQKDPEKFIFHFYEISFTNSSGDDIHTIAFKVLYDNVQLNLYDYSTQPGHALTKNLI